MSAEATSLLGEHLVLVGPMGSGKTTVGRLVAQSIGRPFVDSDDELVRRGLDNRTILAHAGRSELWRAEREVLLDALSSDALVVIAAAASVVDDESCRQALSARATVVALRADLATLTARIAAGAPRPIGADGDALNALLMSRLARDDELASAVLDTSREDPGTTAQRVVDSLRRRVRVPLEERSYDVVIGPGVRREAQSLLPRSVRRAAVVTQAGIDVDVELDVDVETFVIGDGEATKSLQTIETLCRGFSRFGLTRGDVVVALGGGVVTDTAGFAAATYHRGTPLLNVPTTLLGQIDAAIGGKTGVNLPEGKNLVGAFWQPCAVLCDTDVLETMPERERRSGLGEMAKYAFLGVEDLDRLSVVDKVAACVAAKAAVVGADEREGGTRMTLNYGHTLAHALEAAGFADGPGRDGIDLRHGEAVAIGLVFAARLAHLLGRIDAARVARHVELLAGYGLPTELPSGVALEEIVALMEHDKKARAGITFVLDSPAGVEVVDDVERPAIFAALRACLEPAVVNGVAR